jgi:myo-inositol-1(or 4)-monophosphatase
MKEILINALKEAGRIQRENFNKAHQIEQKETISSIVTEVDILCDKIINQLITQAYPLHNILSEESGLSFKHSKYTWVIDPLDGTSNFAAGVPWFGVLIALFENNRPLMAGAYLPVDDKLYFAESGKGAYLNDKRIKLEISKLKNVLVAFSTDYTDDNVFLEKGLEIYRFLIRNARNTRSTNSLVDFMMVAEGKFGGAVNLFTRIWDIAAPWLIIKEAGGLMKYLNGKDLDFELNENAIGKNYPVMTGSLSILKELDVAKREIQN